MSNPFFSLIVPVYNTQAFIKECLKSCLNQSFKDLEVIVIDDCGSDDSIKIAQEFAKEDSRVKIFYNSKNFGTFHSRIEGMKQMRGEYCLFIDSDDVLNLEACETLHRCVMGGGGDNSRVDLVVFNIKGCKWDPILTDVVDEEKSIKKLYGASICARAYHRELIQKGLVALEKYFPKPLPRLVLHEDALQVFILLYFVKTYLVISDVLYDYLPNPKSTTRTTSDLLVLEENLKNKKQILELFTSFKMFPKENQAIRFEEFKENFLTELKKGVKTCEERYIMETLLKQKRCLAFLKYFLNRNGVKYGFKMAVRFLIKSLVGRK